MLCTTEIWRSTQSDGSVTVVTWFQGRHACPDQVSVAAAAPCHRETESRAHDSCVHALTSVLQTFARAESCLLWAGAGSETACEVTMKSQVYVSMGL